MHFKLSVAFILVQSKILWFGKYFKFFTTKSRLFIDRQQRSLSKHVGKGENAGNFKFDENGRKLSKPVENTGGKGEIARYEQFLLFPPQCFQKACFPRASTGVTVWEWVK